MGGRQTTKKNLLVEIHTRIFADDLHRLRRIAEERGIPWQTELRLLIRRALKGEQREVIMIKERE